MIFALRICFYCILLAFAAEAKQGWPTSIERTIKSHKLKTIDELVAHLPEELFAHGLFAYRSQALLGASPENIRPVLFDPKSGFTLTFKSSASEPGPEALEAMWWNKETQKIEFLNIDFPIEDPTRVRWAQPQKCLQCHGSKLSRPIWGEYPNWPGFLGANDDKLDDKERSFIAQMKKIHARNPRLNRLLYRFQGYPDAPFIEKDRENSRKSTWTHMRPNENFGEIVARMSAKQLASFIDRQGLTEKEKLQLALQMAGCSSTTVDLNRYQLELLDFDLGKSFEETSAMDFHLSYFDGSALMRELVAAELVKQVLPMSQYRDFLMRKELIYPLRFRGNRPAREIIKIIDSWGTWFLSPFDSEDPFEISRIRGIWNHHLQRRYEKGCGVVESFLENN